jgi:3-methyl-2-oxobutanoate hydroxymethyltransferase
MPFYPAVLPDVTLAGGADAVFELPGGAGIRQLPGRTGNLGLTPQSVNMLGGTRRVQGRGDAGDQLLADALALERAGAFAVVLESVPASLGRRVSGAAASAPGRTATPRSWSGNMAGLTAGRLPRFVQRYADMRGELLAAATRLWPTWRRLLPRSGPQLRLTAGKGCVMARTADGQAADGP